MHLLYNDTAINKAVKQALYFKANLLKPNKEFRIVNNPKNIFGKLCYYARKNTDKL